MNHLDLIVTLVSRYRQLVHIHSMVYYVYGTSLVSDDKWDEWSNRIIELQRLYPETLHRGYLPEWFYDWTGDTGMHLPQYQDVLGEARRLINASHSSSPS